MNKAIEDLIVRGAPLAGAMPAFRVSITAGELRDVCEKARSQKARLVALWGSDETTRTAG